MEVNRPEYESRLALKKLFFEEMTFTRAEEIEDGTRLDITVNRKIESLPDDSFKISVSLMLLDKEKGAIKISMKAVGCFELAVSEDLDEEFRRAIISENTIAIMFPYIRSQLSLITTQPDLTPIVLPPININALADAIQKPMEQK